MSSQSVLQECKKACHIRVSRQERFKCVKNACPTKVPGKRVKSECLTKVSSKKCQV